MPEPDRFDPAPEDEEGYEAAREHLRRRFSEWATAQGSQLGPDAIEYLVHYKWGYLDRHLTRWRRADLDEVLLELVPAKVVADEGGIEEIVPEACAFVSFLAESGLLDDESEEPAVLLGHLARIGPRFAAAMADRSRYSFGKRFWLEAAEHGVRPDDEEAVEAFVARFNDRAVGEREAVLGQRAGSPPSVRSGRFTPPGTPPRDKPRKRRRRR